MLSLALAVAVVASSPQPVMPKAAQPPVPAPAPATAEPAQAAIEIDETNVDLSGAGRLLFEGDGDAIAALLPETGRAELGGVLTFNHDGIPLGCLPTDEGMFANASKALCNQLVQHARFRLAVGYDLPFRRAEFGYTAYIEKVERPVRPIRLLPPGSGKDLLVWDDSNEKCSILAPSLLPNDEKAICDAWLSAGKPGLQDDAARIWIELEHEPSTSKPGHFLLVSERMIWKRRDILYTAPRPSQEAYLTPGDGRIAIPIVADDYPPRALREDIEGNVKVLIGFDRTGKTVTCRPVESSGTAFLDNSTCALFLRKARFEFAQAAPQFAGLKYRETRLRWMVPRN